MFRTLVLFSLFASFLDFNESAKILAWFPTPSISHQVAFRPITQELAKRGHKLTIITTDPVYPKNESPENITEIDVHDMSYELWRQRIIMKQNEMADDIVQQMEQIIRAMVSVIDLQLNIREMKDIINGTTKFDLFMVEACSFPALPLAHVLKVPVIQVSSFGAIIEQMEAFGAPGHPFLYPSAMSATKTYNLTLWEKLEQLYTFMRISRFVSSIDESTKIMLNKYFEIDQAQINKVIQEVDLLLLNEHPLWTGNRPVPPNVVYMGGIHKKPKGDLPQDLKAYLDSSKNGVIYISFGTNVNPELLPAEKIQTFIKVFSSLPYDVLWKWNQDELPGRSKNIKISKWLPQSDLLYHPKIKLFITQGGIQSADETISAGVPVVGIPFLADQWFNVQQFVRHGLGLQLDVKTLDEEKLRHAIITVIEDKSRIAKLNRDNPRPRSVVVQLASSRFRDHFLAATFKFNKANPTNKLNTPLVGISTVANRSPIYVVEHLSPTNKQLHAEARKKAKELGFAFVWVRNGHIYMRKNEASEFKLIREMSDLNRL